MKSGISFEKTTVKAGTGKLEYRKDPLSERICTVIPALADKIRLFLGETDRNLIGKIAEETGKKCPFCPEAIEKLTPELPGDIFDVKRLRTGEAVAFPNLFPRSEFEAVVVLSKKHCLGLDEFTPEIIASGLKVCMAYIKGVHEKTSIENAMIGCNYMFPAGASAIHPHVQVSMRSIPFYSLELSRQFYERTGSNYWEELVNSEKEAGERYIAETGDVIFLVPFAPSNRNEVLAIVKGKSNFLDYRGKDVIDLAEGVSKILFFYSSKGLSSFNFVIQSATLGSKAEHFWSNLSIISRPNVRANYLSDDSWFGSKLLLENVTAEAPEALAAALKQAFKH